MLETSNLVGAGLVEYSVRAFGPERLIFGSFLPVNDPLVGLGMILDAEIPLDQKGLIAGGNLRRLIGEVRT
jgi:predicted TIM-barrel fold metal-dependent hydrolase